MFLWGLAAIVAAGESPWRAAVQAGVSSPLGDLKEVLEHSPSIGFALEFPYYQNTQGRFRVDYTHRGLKQYDFSSKELTGTAGLSWLYLKSVGMRLEGGFLLSYVRASEAPRGFLIRTSESEFGHYLAWTLCEYKLSGAGAFSLTPQWQVVWTRPDWSQSFRLQGEWWWVL